MSRGHAELSVPVALGAAIPDPLSLARLATLHLTPPASFLRWREKSCAVPPLTLTWPEARYKSKVLDANEIPDPVVPAPLYDAEAARTKILEATRSEEGRTAEDATAQGEHYASLRLDDY